MKLWQGLDRLTGQLNGVAVSGSPAAFKKRRRLSVVVVAMALFLTACGDGGDAAEEEPNDAREGLFGATCNLDGKRIGWPNPQHAPVIDRLWQIMQETAEATNSGAEIEVVDAGGSQERQLEIAEDFLAQDFDALALSLNDVTGWDVIAEEAQEQGVPVVQISPTALTGATQNVAVDHAQAGHLVAEEASRWVEEQGITDIKVGSINDLTIGALKLRSDQFLETFGELHPDAELLETVQARVNDFEETAAAAQSLFSEHPDIDVLYLYSDDNAQAASAALKDTGISDPTKLFIGGADGTPDGVKEIESGESPFQATASFYFDYAAAAMQRDLEAALCGEETMPTALLVPRLVTAENGPDVLEEATSALDPNNRDVYDEVVKYFSEPLETGDPPPSVAGS